MKDRKNHGFVNRPFPVLCFHCGQAVIHRHCDSHSCRWMTCDVCKATSGWVIERHHEKPELVVPVKKFITYPLTSL